LTYRGGRPPTACLGCSTRRKAATSRSERLKALRVQMFTGTLQYQRSRWYDTCLPERSSPTKIFTGPSFPRVSSATTPCTHFSEQSRVYCFIEGLPAPVTRSIAFFAGLSENRGPDDEEQDVVFDHVVTNVRKAYNVKTGRFTSPINGTYQFDVVISALGGRRVGNAVLSCSRSV